MTKYDLKNRGISDPRVLAAMEAVPRERFVPDEMVSQAHGDHPLPIGHGQTISQPYIVAAMTQLLEIKPADRVLEIGTGSGYQTAILSCLAQDVYSVELILALHRRAQQVLEALGYDNVHLLHGDGYEGWPEHAPYAAIMVTAAPPQVPEALIAQLGLGGRMVVPVGQPGGPQTLMILERTPGGIKSRRTMPVAFVPLVRPS